MYLKSLEIQGFKSFPDRTNLQFTTGLTAVVGPNGSGKSNISDAVRWVLGEQSTKNLRGARMEDVIFGGTQQRKAMGFAQVTLYIDNSDGRLQMDTLEVAVTRKLYRSGESEYKINGQNVRLKDIYELFMDTGLGRDGYSMIGQGKIAEIVGAKSTNRREIFEEAAGISKFRYRKTEAERKLVAAQENLLRLKDIMAELEGRVGPLRVQAEKAAKFVELAERRKTLELSLWVAQLDQTRAQLRTQEDKVAASQAAHGEVEEELAAVEAAAEEAFRRMSECTLEIEALRGTIRDQEEHAALAQSQIAVLGNDIFHNNESITRLESEIADQTDARQGLESRLAQKREETDRLQAELETLRGEQTGHGAQYDALALREQQGAAALEVARTQLSRLGLELSEARVAQVSAQAGQSETANRLELLRRSHDERAQKQGELTRERSECAELLQQIAQTLESLQNTAGGVALKRAGVTQRREAIEQELRAVELRGNEKLQKAKLLEGMEQNMEGFSGSVKYLVAQAQKGAVRGVHSAVSKLIEVDAPYATAIETALGGALQNIVVEDDEVAKRCIAMLKDAKAGRATFLPITTIKGNRLNEKGLQERPGFVAIASDLVRCKPIYQNIVESMLGRIVVAEDLNDAVSIARAYGNRFRVVTPDGQLVNAGGSLTGGSVAKSAGLLSRQPEIERLRAQAEEIRKGGDALRVKHKALTEELSALDARALAVASEQKAASEDQIRYESELKRITLALDDLTRSSEDARTQTTRLQARLEQTREAAERAREAAQALAQRRQVCEEALAEQTAEHARLREERETLSQRAAAFELDVLARAKDLEGMRGQLAQLAELREDQGRRVGQYEEQIVKLSESNLEIKERMRALENQRSEVGQRTEEAQRQILRLQAQRQQFEQRSTEVRASEREIMARKEQLARELTRVEERKFALQSEFDTIIARMWDEYEMTRSEAQAAAQPLEDLPAAQRALGEVKAAVKALGTVNLEAIDEYEEVSGRYHFLKKQIDDVERSREQLGRIINELTAQMRELFLESFGRINDHFGKIFAELFGGGKASLTLTDESNVLESGVEINVQPPGKLIKNLAALSGGEQAFVAIAIYFAILKVRPAPFCLLDEIEAALDDVNVVKYAQYLKRLGVDTQFIAITHRRGTMEEADVLYGVTMQEEGVSKLLELSVSELESKLGWNSQQNPA